jgi:Uncharacterized conserved protein
MLQFQQITISDKKKIDTCLQGNDYRVCDFCFTNLFAWQSKFKTLFSIVEETLFLCFEDDDCQQYYFMPVGKMPLEKSFSLIKEDAEKRGIPFQMKGVSEKMWKQIQEIMPNKLCYENDRNNAEYIYLSAKLISLRGKKLQSKRNHINQFKTKHSDWQYVSIQTKEDCAECLSMLEAWEAENNPNDGWALRYDFIATKTMLDNFHYLQLRGGIIRANGKIVAFTIGEPLTSDTFCVHVEKAFSEINGAYAIINQQFIEHEASDFTYINREEDMGLENLRKAKKSYYPDILLQEGVVKL